MRPLLAPLYTERLRLEPVTPALADAAARGDAALAARVQADLGAWAPARVAALAGPRAAWGPPPAPTHALIVSLEAARVIGDVRFEPTPRFAQTVELGYGVAAEFRQRGYATEAAGAVLDWLFTEGGAARVIAGCHRANAASVRVLRRLGFELDGSAGTAFWWAITPAQREAAC